MMKAIPKDRYVKAGDPLVGYNVYDQQVLSPNQPGAISVTIN